MISACALIPCYNHGAAVGDVVRRLRAQDLPVLIVDDGSDAATVAALESLSREHGVHVFRLAANSGKGAAFLRGIEEAARLGFTHALQIDADGQHRVEDALRFLQAARARPAAVVCGRALYDESAPKSRLYGRRFSHLWVWIETLSFAVADSMCGFRLYPVSQVQQLARKVRIAPRMNFDVDIIVRLCWEGLPVVNVDTRVVYPPDGVSHFRMVRDNVSITWTHTKLVLGMLPRIPRILARRGNAAHWSRIGERGSGWGLRLVAATRERLGHGAARLLVLPAVLYFFLTGAAARRASRKYLRRLHAHGGGATPAPTAWNVLRHMLAFADSSLDKLGAWRGDRRLAPASFEGEEHFLALSRERRGALFIGAHLGNLEMMRAIAATRGAGAVTAVVYTNHARRFASALGAANPDFNERLMEVSEFGPQTAIAMRERIARGEILVIVGDRTPPAENGRIGEAPFLGHAAPFPQGPIILAHLLECPVYLFFCLKQEGVYRAFLEPFARRLSLPREGREAAIDAHLARYAGRLEWYCRAAPLQWFNFFDFWHEPVR